MTDSPGLAITRLTLTDFRNYAGLRLESDAQLVALTGRQWRGQDQLLEAISLLAPGRGLRGAAFEELARQGGPASWAIAAEVETPHTGPSRSAPAGAASRKRAMAAAAWW